MSRDYTIRGAVKRLGALSLRELATLGIRDLQKIRKLNIILEAANTELESRHNNKVPSHV